MAGEVGSVNEKKVTVGRDENGFAKFGEHDLTLIIEGDKIYVCKAVLCIASPVFQEMLKDQSEVQLPGKNYEDFVEFLCCIYPDRLKDISADNVYGILPLATEYQVQILKERCQKCILKIVNERYTVNAVEIYRHLQLSELYELTALKGRCIHLASELSLTKMIEGSSAYQVSDESVLQIRFLTLQRMELDLADDVYIFKLSMIHDTKTSGVSSTVSVENIVSYNVGAGSSDCKDLLRAARIYKRFDSSACQTNLRNIISKLNGLSTDKYIQYKEELELLPEAVKRSLTIV